MSDYGSNIGVDAYTKESELPTRMTINEVAAWLRIDKSTVYRMTRNGIIPATKIANQWIISAEGLVDYLGAGGETEQADKLGEEDGPGERKAYETLADIE